MCLDFTKGTQYKHWLYKDTETLGKSGEAAASAHEARSHSAAHLNCLAVECTAMVRDKTNKLAQKVVLANKREV